MNIIMRAGAAVTCWRLLLRPGGGRVETEQRDGDRTEHWSPSPPLPGHNTAANQPTQENYVLTVVKPFSRITHKHY